GFDLFGVDDAARQHERESFADDDAAAVGLPEAADRIRFDVTWLPRLRERFRRLRSGFRRLRGRGRGKPKNKQQRDWFDRHWNFRNLRSRANSTSVVSISQRSS